MERKKRVIRLCPHDRSAGSNHFQAHEKSQNDPAEKEPDNKKLILELKQTTDILKYLGDNKKKYFLIGFALETDNELKNARNKLKNKNLDMIVLNNPEEKGAGFGYDTNIVTFIDETAVKKYPKMSKFEVGNAILDYYLSKKSSE